MFLVIFITYFVVFALLCGWLYGMYQDVECLYIALVWPIILCLLPIIGLAYLSYKVKCYFDSMK